MRKLLWAPSEERKAEANITRFIGLVNKLYGSGIGSYDELYKWSVEHIQEFWAAVWGFVEIKASGYDTVVDDLGKFPGARWFPGSRLNFAENLLRFRDDRLAFIFRGEGLKSGRMTYAELYDSVANLANSLRKAGVAAGDRIVAYMPNLIETPVAMLAATSIGAAWSSC